MKNTSLYLEQVARFTDLSEFNWSNFQGKMFFSNDYETSIDEDTLLLLNEFYKRDML